MRGDAEPEVSCDPETILTFWFGDSASSAAADRDRLWFGGPSPIDDVIRERFGGLPEKAAQGGLDDWRNQARSSLALVLVLDQFPRNLYRGTALSFAFDDRALDVAATAIDKGFDRQLEPVEAVFLYMPYEHSEDIGVQEQCLSLFRALVERTPGHLQERIRNYQSYAVRHYRVIERFGRFPHRNAVLERATTDEERRYLESGGDRF